MLRGARLRLIEQARYPTSVEPSKGILVAVAIGSNVGDRHVMVARAISEIAGLPSTRLLARSSVIQTAPVPIDGTGSAVPADDASTGDLGGPYLNAAVLLRTNLEPEEMLRQLLEIERRLGRTRTPGQRAEPRTIDLDIAVYGSLVMQTPVLTLPHPRLHHREFVLAPLAQIAPALIVPGIGRSVLELLADLRTIGGAT